MKPVIYIFIGVLATIMGIVVISCSSTTTHDDKNAMGSLQSLDLHGDSKTLKGTTDTIRTNTGKIEVTIGPAVAATVRDPLNGIHSALGTQDKLVLDLENKAKVKDDALKTLKDASETKDKEIADLKEQVRQKTGWLTYGLVGLGTLIAAAGVGVIILGVRLLGIAAVASGIALSVLTLVLDGIRQHMAIILGVGGGLCLLVILVLIYYCWVHRKALWETVKTVEAMKPTLTPDQKTAVFGSNQTPVADQIQSDSTQSVVADIRDQIKAIKAKIGI